jgi:dolichyl-phosphate beta-glucosyltransferase
MSVVVPAYNEEERLSVMLEEAVDYLEQEYGPNSSAGSLKQKENGKSVKSRQGKGNGSLSSGVSRAPGWEIIIVSDGSTDATIPTALSFARAHSKQIPPSSIRVVKLDQNRGKGGAVVHGMRHVRGQYVIFADADGASKFEDLGKLVTKAQELEETDSTGRAVVIGSRAHLVGSEAVVKVRHAQKTFIPLTKCEYSVLSSAILSCMPFISFSAYSLLQQRHPSAILSAASNYSHGRRCLT